MRPKKRHGLRTPAAACVILMAMPLALLCSLCLALPQGEQERLPLWEALSAEQAEKAKGGFVQKQVRERDGALLQASGAVLKRSYQGQDTTIACTISAGTGQIYDLAADPAGLVFVAAEHGLFVLGPDVTHLDPVRLAEGAPTGQVLALHVDGRRRLWLGTSEALGVVDPSFFWGRSFSAADGLPPGGPYAVTGGGAGFLLVSSKAGVFRYRLDQGARDREGLVLAEPLDLSGPIPRGKILDAETARYFDTWRYRLDGHHVTRALLSSTSFAEEPGKHRLELLAYDRDLNPLQPSVHVWEVPYPFYYSKSFVLAAGCASAFIAFAFFLRRSSTLAQALVSSALLLCLILQVLAGLVPHAKGWPFVGFGMYSRATPARGLVTEEALYAMNANGRWRKLDAIQLGVAVDTLLQIVRPLVSEGGKAAEAYVQRWEEMHPGQVLHGLQVQVRRQRLLPDGPVAVAPLILLDWRKEGSRDG